mmetsp:Transcript_47424/g.57424  ORF Transcript_47424/g.57424 Transcript_47424/m.57424 type:complete len:419 (+) Transcript_47424:311-1567(+)|eukprot:CAMPEP_0172489702 /NCGR_PEP_ID=MMETSP1066-20121228/19890_1 /TAXON_ID=671091 /ORGANISM="Coscinodiscus wailesii, Strain CCMP2513" /LENGTH=418 /DNA_ID=CAMNT_0013257769 /DNA_START=402 /DNA_END=1658 /DNA_ORIENTATION=+
MAHPKQQRFHKNPITLIVSGGLFLYLALIFTSVTRSNLKSDSSNYEKNGWTVQTERRQTISKKRPVAFLTIAVDNRISCPDKCVFGHGILPNWVKYRYIVFADVDDLQKTLSESLPEDDTHLMIVARTNIVNLANFASTRRSRLKKSVGLWHMADERLVPGEIKGQYNKFDYVIRHYLRFGERGFHTFDITLRALGNHTCGSSPPLPVTGETLQKEPRFGSHWIMLGPHEDHSLLRFDADEVWPTSRRPLNCSFHGRKDVHRSKGERKMMYTAFNDGADGKSLNCDVSYSTGFAAGKSKFDYLAGDLQNNKIGLSPRGSNVETHRLTEALIMGAVPAVVDEPYLHAPYQTVPAIIGKDWESVAKEMKRLLSDERRGGKELENLQEKGVQFYKKYEKCVKSDFNLIMTLIDEYYTNFMK